LTSPGLAALAWTRIVPRLADVPGVVGVVLGGSRARGTANDASDYDIGLYHGTSRVLDTEHLLGVVRNLVDDATSATVTPVGGWGPRIVGGGWLSIGGRKVDLLDRSVESVSTVIADCHTGRISMDYQPGHPHGFCSAIWMGEVALCQSLHDPQGVIAQLKASTSLSRLRCSTTAISKARSNRAPKQFRGSSGSTTTALWFRTRRPDACREISRPE